MEFFNFGKGEGKPPPLLTERKLLRCVLAGAGYTGDGRTLEGAIEEVDPILVFGG